MVRRNALRVCLLVLILTLTQSCGDTKSAKQPRKSPWAFECGDVVSHVLSGQKGVVIMLRARFEDGYMYGVRIYIDQPTSELSGEALMLFPLASTTVNLTESNYPIIWFSKYELTIFKESD